MTQPGQTPPGLNAELAKLRAAYPTPEALSAQMGQELSAFEETMRAAQPYWNIRMPGREWTPAEEADHTIRVNEGSGRLIRLLLSDKPMREMPRPEGVLKDGRRQAPAGTEPGPEQPLEALVARNTATRALLADLSADLLAGADARRTGPHPFLGDLDALDWLRMAAYQTRHHRQTLQTGLDRLNAGERAEP